MDYGTPSLPVHHQLQFTHSCPLSQWCHPTISSSAIPFSSYLQSFPASGSFPSSQFFTSGSQSIGVSASPSNDYSGLMCFKMDWLDLLAVQGPLKTLVLLLSLPLHVTPSNFSYTLSQGDFPKYYIWFMTNLLFCKIFDNLVTLHLHPPRYRIIPCTCSL